MKYAIPVSGGVVCSHFGHCEHFALIDVDEEKNKIIKKELVPSPEHQPGLLPTWLAEKGVGTVIAGGMGMSAQNLLQQRGVNVVLGVQDDDPETVVLNHLNGRLTTGKNICDH